MDPDVLKGIVPLTEASSAASIILFFAIVSGASWLGLNSDNGQKLSAETRQPSKYLDYDNEKLQEAVIRYNRRDLRYIVFHMRLFIEESELWIQKKPIAQTVLKDK